MLIYSIFASNFSPFPSTCIYKNCRNISFLSRRCRSSAFPASVTLRRVKPQPHFFPTLKTIFSLIFRWIFCSLLSPFCACLGKDKSLPLSQPQPEQEPHVLGHRVQPAHCSVAAAFRTLVVRSFILHFFFFFVTFINSKEVCA